MSLHQNGEEKKVGKTETAKDVGADRGSGKWRAGWGQEIFAVPLGDILGPTALVVEVRGPAALFRQQAWCPIQL